MKKVKYEGFFSKDGEKVDLISENVFNQDFSPITGFYNYHVKGKKINTSLDAVQNLGVGLEVKSLDEIGRFDFDDIPTNTIKFSSSKRNQNIRNLAWTIRCLAHHIENVHEIDRNGQKCYEIVCLKKEEKKGIYPTMKGVVACDVWANFVKSFMDKIKTLEKS